MAEQIAEELGTKLRELYPRIAKGNWMEMIGSPVDNMNFVSLFTGKSVDDLAKEADNLPEVHSLSIPVGDTLAIMPSRVMPNSYNYMSGPIVVGVKLDLLVNENIGDFPSFSRRLNTVVQTIYQSETIESEGRTITLLPQDGKMKWGLFQRFSKKGDVTGEAILRYINHELTTDFKSLLEFFGFIKEQYWRPVTEKVLMPLLDAGNLTAVEVAWYDGGYYFCPDGFCSSSLHEASTKQYKYSGDIFVPDMSKSKLESVDFVKDFTMERENKGFVLQPRNALNFIFRMGVGNFKHDMKQPTFKTQVQYVHGARKLCFEVLYDSRSRMLFVYDMSQDLRDQSLIQERTSLDSPMIKYLCSFAKRN